MDRPDELRERRVDDTREDGEQNQREGDVLGIGGTEVPKSPGDPTTDYDPESVRKRHDRAMRDDVVRRPSDDQHGATGIDMGAGGHGTDVSRD
jgi:hypothetical protein